MKSSETRIVWLQTGAPPKPPLGQTCNGCGLCCLSAPCPLGMLVSRRRTGACAALRWSAVEQRYRCGLLSEPADVTGWRSPWLLRAVRAVAQRQIAAGSGCDATVEAIQANAP
ncbi:MAG: hypothetical protein IPJ36_17110 [Simplicispira sp.]|nr:hypothetical protein [Simplicispira sp.]